MTDHDVADLDAARQQLGMTMLDLWTDYFALGGRNDAAALSSYLHGTAESVDRDHDLIVHALNEAFVERGHNHPIPYRLH